MIFAIHAGSAKSENSTSIPFSSFTRMAAGAGDDIFKGNKSFPGREPIPSDATLASLEGFATLSL
jgi:hypothetical protein